MLVHLVTAAALAGGFYHPNDIAAASQVFVDASERSMAPLEDVDRQLSALSAALVQYEEALDLLGDRAPAEDRERLEALRKEYNREYAQLQAFADAVVEDFDAEFTAAMERALSKHGGAVVCERLVAAGRALPGMPARMEKNPACTGDDLNETVAAAMDADPTLKKAVAEITGVTWPTVDLTTEARPVVGDGERWIDVRSFVGALAKDALREIRRTDERERAEFEMSIAEGASKEELARLVADARGITERTAAARAGVARPILAAADGVLAKWASKGKPATAWCANPEVLGGCAGTAADDGFVRDLLDDKKVLKAR